MKEGMHCYDFIDHNLYNFCKTGHYTCMVDLLGSPGHQGEAETPDTCTTLRGKWGASAAAHHFSHRSSPGAWLWSSMATADRLGGNGGCSYAPVKMRTEIKVLT
jgi:hypothetical protein